MVDHPRLPLRPRRLAVHAGIGGAARGEDQGVKYCVPRTQRSAISALRASSTRYGSCGAVRCRAGVVTSAGVWYGPGFAKQRFAKCYALHRARDTKSARPLLPLFAGGVARVAGGLAF